MATHKYIDRICLTAALLSLLAALILSGSGADLSNGTAMGYETRLFDTGRVHTIDIVMDDWDAFLETCENEEYAACAVVVDGEVYKNIGIRAKGNTSLSMVSAMDSSRYSFKLEFDQYETGRTYYGLDKLCLNNLIQDNTFMKDYLTYRMMADFDVDAPLCSYVYITVNGQDWGLYLAVEGVEESYMQRTGKNGGDLYKPDSLSMGGGRGNGREFNMEDLDWGEDGRPDFQNFRRAGESASVTGGNPGDGNQPNLPEAAGNEQNSQPEDGNQPNLPEAAGNEQNSQPGDGNQPNLPAPGGMSGPPDFAGGMGAADVKLQYIDDDPDSYANIFDSAKTDVTKADKTRLIAALKDLSEGNPSALDMEQVLRYFVVHNYVCNGDSYTGSMIHNYYLYEEEGRLSMIPWDYNLAFGTFQAQDAASAVNDPIDTPLSVTGAGDRPMIDWIFNDELYTEQYHQLFEEFLETIDTDGMIAETSELIAPYVEKDPTKFCTYEDFQTAVRTLTDFCQRRTESVAGQLAGTIPATSDGQTAEPSSLVDASGLNLSDMGTMNQGGGGRRGQRSDNGFAPTDPQNPEGNAPTDGTAPQNPEGNAPTDGTAPQNLEGNAPTDGTAPQNPEGNAPTDGTAPQNLEGNAPTDGTAPQNPESNAPPDRMPMPPEGVPDRTAFNGGPMGMGGPPGFPNSSGGDAAAGPESLILLGVSVLILLAGVLLAKRYRRWGK